MNRVVWVRGFKEIDFNRPSTFFCLGVRGSAKSSYLESVAAQYLDHGHAVLDLFGSRDGEGLAWLRSPYAKTKKILLLRGSNVDVKNAPCDVKEAAKLELSDFDKYDIVISASPLYIDPADEFDNAARITDLLYRRRHWQRLIYMLVREASNLYFARLKLVATQTEAKAEMVYLCREARHAGVALGLDTLRQMGIDIDIRVLSDFEILKAQGLLGLPRELYWVYSIYKPERLQSLPRWAFVIISKEGAVGLGEFDEIPWHKQEKEDIVSGLGMVIEYGEPIVQSKNFGTFNTISDPQHAEIITLYASEGLSMGKISERIERSKSTVKEHIDQHNEAIKRSGFCPNCRRVKSPFDAKEAVRAMPEVITK